MIDRLLGRASLKARIDELEGERDSAVARMEAEEERRAEAARKRQEAEERVNRLEDRIEELEDRIDRAEAEGDADLSYRGTETLRRDRLDAVLRRLESVDAGAEGALSAFVAADGDVPDEAAAAFGDRSALVRRAAPTLVYRDDAGLVSCALRPPLAPDPFAEWADGFRVREEWFRPTGRFAFALARADTFALGVYEGTERVAFESVETDVMNEHDKGGFSQARFERQRDEQIAAHVDDCAAALDAVEGVDRTVLVGERSVLSELDEYADHTAGSDATGDPEEALADAFADFWTATLRLV
ncbi:Vms1/Ankzf1 family peptidyl-tRNA hydrolase [Candidatus Halobonum tyrrellensis]|uniref:Actinobacteria/chloroflexi VLRF1 release factor domain-containing protein n=1 Tax=Candidatus Halobonum tyrrellensis G22 TaxID=1324957 RepID=V4HBU0_9EURY|nr:Vms1/Ankzf1 family peptidyl-tRNA hydrolase [Candidatus Halobonum tyrrellensis]ESP88175.1 hypothetical protein K933_10205 [Candidatus Halobonum tyrrellensis G22]